MNDLGWGICIWIAVVIKEEDYSHFQKQKLLLTHFKKLKIENLTSRTGYRICGAWCKMIVQGPLLKND